MHVFFMALAAPLLATPLVATPLAATPSAAATQETADAASLASDEISKLLDIRIVEMEKGDLADLWDLAQKMAIEVGDEYGKDFDSALDARLESLSADTASGQGKQTLFLVASRIYGEDVEPELLATSLVPLLESQVEGVAQGAMNLMPLAGVDSLEEDPRGSATEALLEFAESEDKTSDLRVLAAMTAHKVGLGRQVPRAQRVLNGFLNASNPVLRGEGALALAQLGVIGDHPGVQSELEALSKNPGPRGQLAAALLKQESLHTYYQNALTRAREDRATMVSDGNVGKDIQALESLISFVQNYHLEGPLFTREQLLDSAYNGLLNSLDRHSSYFSSSSFKRFEQDLEAEYGGIGAYVGIDREDGLFTITRPLYSGPAYKEGIQSDDKIVRIEEWPTVGEKLEDVIKRLKGRPGTDVKLYIWRRGMDPGLIDRPTEEMAISITRGQITIPPVHSELLPGNVGLVELTTFSKVASRQLKDAIEALMAQGATSLVLDLRNNTGGLLVEARNVADLFLPKGKLVTRTVSKIRDREREWKTRKAPLVPEDMPVSVLINRFSASASEIVAGALQDYDRATLVGQRSFGKGSVQNLFALPGAEDDEFADENNNRRHDTWEKITTDHNGNGEFDFAPRIKLTIERYLLPTGRSIHRELDKEGNITSPGGIAPDEEVSQKRRAIWELTEMRRVQGTRKLREYVEDMFPKHKEQLTLLANNDMHEYSAYPEFESLYKDLETVLSRQDVRFLLRMEVRRRVQDERGSAFPLGDFETDLQLQAAIKDNLKKLKRDLVDVEAFARTFSLEEEDESNSALLARAEGLRKALELLGPEDHALTTEETRRLRELLQEASGQN